MNTRAVRAVLELVADADAICSVEDYHMALLAALAKAVPCDVVNFNDFRFDPPAGALAEPAVSCTAAPPLEPADALAPSLLATFLRHMAEHPLIHLQAAGDASAHRLSDVVSVRRFRHGGLYADFFRPAAIAHQLTVGFGGSPHHLVGVWLSRTDRDFSDGELLLAELLRPHLEAGEAAASRAVARASLTERERQVLQVVAAGASNRAVAEVLVVSPGTVKKHLDNIYAKLAVGTRAAAVDRAGARTRRTSAGSEGGSWQCLVQDPDN
ncbi:MAG TPA: helix-turn-helix transcriptional regulator [Gaiellaceae bacterium]|nr:helix-turn-helix transcriptional regulator [Gaiellaceae bacterium]